MCAIATALKNVYTGYRCHFVTEMQDISQVTKHYVLVQCALIILVLFPKIKLDMTRSKSDLYIKILPKDLSQVF